METVAIIPCLNEQEHISSVVSNTKQYVNEVVVADNGSIDQTAYYAKRAGAVVITCPERGLGNNLIHTFNKYLSYKNPKIIILMDGDGQHEPADIPRLLRPIQMGLADVVVGDRYNSPSIRWIGIKLLAFIFNIGHPIKVNDPVNGFRAIKNGALAIPTDKGWGCYSEMLEDARRNKKRIVSVSVRVHYLENHSCKRSIWLGMCLLWNIVKHRIGSI